jgi:hypothetical protein
MTARPSFGGERERREPRFGERAGAGVHLALQLRLAGAGQNERDVREQRDVSCSDRADRGHDRMHAPVEQRDQQLRDFGPCAGAPARKPVRSDEHRCADDVGGQRRSHGIRPSEHGQQRELRERIVGKSLDHTRAEPGGEPVRR